MKLTLKSLNLKLKILIRVLFFARLLPEVLKPGDQLEQIMLTLIGYKKTSYLAVLIKHINNYAFKKGIKQIFCICEQNHTMLASLKGFIKIPTTMCLYIKPFKENFMLNNDSVFIDGIDM
ncbi:MAG: hypothetical protein GY707_09235 [Desulfobacteraceae bacterium]|nr:hypothetical protein [Desulfobacteraceae bacterium]